MSEATDRPTRTEKPQISKQNFSSPSLGIFTKSHATNANRKSGKKSTLFEWTYRSCLSNQLSIFLFFSIVIEQKAI